MSANSLKKGFSLIELLIVIVIIGVVYKLAVINMEKINKPGHIQPDIKHLKDFLLSFEFEKSSQLICTKNCTECKVLLDEKKEKSIKPFFDDTIKVYTYTKNEGFFEKELMPVFNQNGVAEDVCFRYKTNKNGIGDQVIVKYKNKIFDFREYFDDVKVYDSLDQLQNKKEQELLKILS